MERAIYSSTDNGSVTDFHGWSGRSSKRSSEEKPSAKERTRHGSTPILVSSNTVLRGLSQKHFEMLRPHLRRVQLTKEQFLYQQDDELSSVYFPESAVVSEFHILDDGRMVEVSITGREGAVGISCLYGSDRVANCVQVSQAGYALKIEASILQKLARQEPALAAALYPTLATYIRQISQKAVCNMYHSVAERFCTWLLMLQDRSGRSQLKLTHEQIARTLGVYRPSVTCIALELRKNGHIDYSRGGISIKNRELMENSACGCYFELDHDLTLPRSVASVNAAM